MKYFSLIKKIPQTKKFEKHYISPFSHSSYSVYQSTTNKNSKFCRKLLKKMIMAAQKIVPPVKQCFYYAAFLYLRSVLQYISSSYTFILKFKSSILHVLYHILHFRFYLTKEIWNEVNPILISF